MAIYAISDIRGYYDKFIEMLNLIGHNSDDCLVLVGNSIDETPGSYEMIKWIIKHDYRKIILLRGSNEEKFIQCINHIIKSNKPDISLTDNQYNYYNIILDLIAENISLDKLYKRFYTSKSYMRKIGSYKYTFANSCVPSSDYKNNIDFCLYSKYNDIFLYGGVDISFYYNIFGHYSTVEYYDKDENKGKIIYYNLNNKNFININCGVYLPNNQGNLGCLRLDDLKEFYI